MKGGKTKMTKQKLERPVNEEIREICKVIVGGLDKNIDILPENYKAKYPSLHDALESAIYLAKDLDGDSFQGFGNYGEYFGGYDGNQKYSLAGNHNTLNLTETQARAVVEGKLEKVLVDFEWDS